LVSLSAFLFDIRRSFSARFSGKAPGLRSRNSLVGLALEGRRLPMYGFLLSVLTRPPINESKGMLYVPASDSGMVILAARIVSVLLIAETVHANGDNCIAVTDRRNESISHWNRPTPC